MKHIVLATLSILILSGCSKTNLDDAKTSSTSGYGYKAICLDGVQYWESMKRFGGRIDPTTLQPKLCE